MAAKNSGQRDRDRSAYEMSGSNIAHERLQYDSENGEWDALVSGTL